MFDKDLQKKRLSNVSYNKVCEYECVFLQFPTFTYIWVGYFTGEPFMLPIYPSHKIVVMELCRQLVYLNERQSSSHKTSLKCSQSIGRYSVMTTEKAKNMEEETQWVKMRRFNGRNNFDFHGIKKQNLPKLCACT